MGARKLAQSHDVDEDPTETDAAILAFASGENPEDVCPASLTYPVPMAPPMAAEAMGANVPTLDDLLSFQPWGEDAMIGLVETAGGLRSPQAADADALDVIVALDPELVILVGDAGLGTISTVRLCHDAIVNAAPEVSVVVVLNRFDAQRELHERNRSWLRSVDGFEVVSAPEELNDLVTKVRALSPAE